MIAGVLFFLHDVYKTSLFHDNIYRHEIIICHEILISYTHSNLMLLLNDIQKIYK